jgi:hypothetical protein
MPRKPSIKQAKAMANLLENGGNVTRAMLDANFSPATANNPKNLTESKAFKENFADRIPDDLLAKRHLELLNKREVVKTFSHETGETEVEITDQPDTQAVSKALDMAYKLKGSYAPDKSLTLSLTIPDIIKTLEEDAGT